MAGVYLYEGDFPEETRFAMIGEVAIQLYSTLVAEWGGASPLAANYGRSFTVLRRGFTRMPVVPAAGQNLDDAADALRKYVWEQFRVAAEVCESPIERDMLSALLTADWTFTGASKPMVRLPGTEPLPHPVVIAPQLEVGRARIDLAVVIQREGKEPRIFAIECDGAAFHNRPADQERDSYLDQFGVHVFHASGRLIKKAPIAVADIIALTCRTLTK